MVAQSKLMDVTIEKPLEVFLYTGTWTEAIDF